MVVVARGLISHVDASISEIFAGSVVGALSSSFGTETV